MNEKGYTIKELFVLIMGIAIIFIVGTIIILNVISNARKQSLQEKAYGLISSAKNYTLSAENTSIAEDSSQLQENEIEGNKQEKIIINFEDQNTIPSNFNYSGKLPDSGKLEIDEEGKISLAIWSDEANACALKNKKTSKVHINTTKNKQNCTLN